jgi:hypothetical protein
MASRSSASRLGERAPAGRCGCRFLVPRRGRLVDYGAALEMRFGATRRGFESRPLRHLRTTAGRPSARWPAPVLATSRQWRRGAPRWTLVSVHRLPALGAQSNIEPARKPALLSFVSRARRGTSGALNLQSAPAGLNSHPRSPSSNATASSDVEDRVPRSGDSRPVSGPEGRSTKRSSSGAAERPGPSRSSRRARDHGGRRWVHGISSSSTPGSPAAGAP